jgi:N-acetylglutamate synthase-like GNAT family acetyltransferase
MVKGEQMTSAKQPATDVTIRPLQERDLDVADQVMRMAFGTFLEAPDPMLVFGDADLVRPRFAAAPNWAFVAEREGEVVGSNFATRWGSFGFFGPLTVRHDLWDRGIANRLMEPIVELIDSWQVRQAGLFTFPQSAKHIWLYQRFGFWPRQLTPVMEKDVSPPAPSRRFMTYSETADAERPGALSACRDVTHAIFDGLDVEHEIRATHDQSLGDTVLLDDGSGFAVCHCDTGEAGSGACFVKFGAVRPGSDAAERFERLLEACERLAADRGLRRMVAGVNVARHEAYRKMLERGYRTFLQGVVMLNPNEDGYCRADAYVIDDLR